MVSNHSWAGKCLYPPASAFHQSSVLRLRRLAMRSRRLPLPSSSSSAFDLVVRRVEGGSSSSSGSGSGSGSDRALERLRGFESSNSSSSGSRRGPRGRGVTSGSSSTSGSGSGSGRERVRPLVVSSIEPRLRGDTGFSSSSPS